MGVGLNICRSVVEAHGGTLTHHPNPEGGTLFCFTLPALTSTEAPNDAPLSADQEPAPQREGSGT
jgi:two-component system sensor histidine kinase DctS